MFDTRFNKIYYSVHSAAKILDSLSISKPFLEFPFAMVADLTFVLENRQCYFHSFILHHISFISIILPKQKCYRYSNNLLFLK